MIDSTPINCLIDLNTPYQIVIKNSPKTINSGTPYKLKIFGISCPRSLYMNNNYPNRFIFIGLLDNFSSDKYSERALILP